MFLTFARFLYWLWRYRSRLRANWLARKGNVEGAINYIEREIESKGPSGEHYYILGALHNRQKEWDKALLAFEEAVWRGGRQPEYLTSEAVALWNLGRLQEAAALMEEGCPRNPQDLDAVCNHAFNPRGFRALGRSVAAISTRRQVMSVDGHFPTFRMECTQAAGP